ncbi:MAG: hypothetical protein KDD36_09710 [Flavobacteriales bacterium]|nr:hypothetical protein [Flavobacteriales bacterium]
MPRTPLLKMLFWLIPAWLCMGSGERGNDERTSIRLGFYNVENLFHPSDDSLTMDEAFTPSGEQHWSYSRYQEKLVNTSKVIMALGEWQGVTALGLCEIENRKVLEDLTARTPLKSKPWGIIHHDSHDPRGIDVGLIYRKDRLTILYDSAIAVVPPNSNYQSRDILYVKALAYASDTLHLFINHWPSRRGGQQVSEHKRIGAAKILRACMDSILIRDSLAMIISMGDFNDGPHNTSISKILDAGSMPPHRFQHAMSHAPPTTGTHRYDGQWEILDQIIVSPSLSNGHSGWKSGEGQIFRKDFLMTEDLTHGGQKPWRTFTGPKYIGGFSDHLPVFVDLQPVNHP